jgi:hypothetical protein
MGKKSRPWETPYPYYTKSIDRHEILPPSLPFAPFVSQGLYFIPNEVMSRTIATLLLFYSV